MCNVILNLKITNIENKKSDVRIKQSLSPYNYMYNQNIYTPELSLWISVIFTAMRYQILMKHA